MKFKTLFLTLLVSFVFCFSAFSQGGGGNVDAGAPLIKPVIVPACHEATDGTQTSFYRLYWHRVGDTAPKFVDNYLNADGTPYTIPATGTVLEGQWCEPPSSTPDCELEPWCDAGTNFVRVYNTVKNPDGTFTTESNDYTADGSATYTPSGAEVPEWCSSVTETSPAHTRLTTTSTGTLAADTYESVCIVNVGCFAGTLTVNGGTAEPFYPAERYCAHAQYDPVDNEWHLIDAIDYDATGTEYVIVHRTKD